MADRLVTEIDEAALASEFIEALDSASLLSPPSERFADLDFSCAYRIAAESMRLRCARGEQVVGRKIGYTNPAMWARFNVHQPIWDHVYRHTVQFVRDNTATQPIAQMVAPRIEPEIAFRLSGLVPVGCDDSAEVLRSVDWVARTFEVVDCHYPDWKFSGPDSVIDFSHHAALIVGEPLEINARDIPRMVDALRDCRVTLLRDGLLADTGVGANALGHPALALARLADVIASQPDAPPLSTGEIITTGTLTVARPIKRGEIWRTETDGLALPPLTIRFE